MKPFRTYRKLDAYDQRQLRHDAPSCFNRMVRVRQYKITVELIDEPDEVIRARLQKLWDECDNWHHWEPLKKEAKKYGLMLTK